MKRISIDGKNRRNNGHLTPYWDPRKSFPDKLQVLQNLEVIPEAPHLKQ